MFQGRRHFIRAGPPSSESEGKKQQQAEGKGGEGKWREGGREEYLFADRPAAKNTSLNRSLTFLSLGLLGNYFGDGEEI